MKQEQPHFGFWEDRPRFIQRLLWALVWAAPGIWLGYLIYAFGVDVPYKDQWDAVCPLLQAGAEGTLQLRDFWAWHMEHRLFFPRILMYGLAKLTHWNIRAELFVVWLLAWVCALNVWRMARVTSWPSKGGLGLLFLANTLIFTPLGVENWLWGFQIEFFLPMACLTASLWIAPSLRFPGNFLVTMVLCVICTFSIASGFISWLLAGTLLFFSPTNTRCRGNKLVLPFWVLGFLFTTVLYFQGYAKPNHAFPDLTESMRHPILGLQFLLTYLGNPFAFGTPLVNVVEVSASVGAILLFLVIAATTWVWRWRRNSQFLSEALPWFMLIMFALSNAAITSAGRYHMGAIQALSSRYLAFSAMLPVGLLFLGSVCFRHWRIKASPGKSQAVRLALNSLATALVVLHGLGALPFAKKWKDTQRAMLTAKALVMLINIVDASKELRVLLYPNDAALLKERVNFLNQRGFLRPSLVRSNTIRQITGTSNLNPAAFGRIETAARPSADRIGIKGWAVLPTKLRPAHVVIFTYSEAVGEPIIFSISIGGTPREDIAKTFRQTGYIDSGWSKVFDRSMLPANARTINAWSFDAEEGRAYPIEGNVTLAQ